MTAYAAPLTDMRFVLDEVADLASIARLPGYEEATPDLTDAVLEEAGKLAAEVLSPLNRSGDQEGAAFENGVVRTAKGFREAYAQYVESGWNALPFDPDYGGQGLPWALATVVQEMWNSANMSFALCPLLTQGAVELLQAHGSDAQKDLWLPKMISGEWTGTMNLTEPQAGSDVGALKTRAEPREDHYLITGQKIFITYGEHDLTDNIVHMVLARTPGAPAGTKGISLFLVPKVLVNEDGSLGPHNDLRCVSIEHKLGIKASPTAVLAFGDSGGAVGTLIGEENRGMAYMFTMMNNARLAVGVQGLAIAERAYQQALAYARERSQSSALGAADPAPVKIVRHPDVRRMLLTMKSQIEAMRALIYVTAAALDRAKREPDEAARARAQTTADQLIPVAKAWSTDLGCEIASLGVQVHGGMGYIEEAGAAQHYRDARIAPIYEGTNGIQALDLLGRKLLRDDGAGMAALLDEMRATLADLETLKGKEITALRGALGEGILTLEAAGDFLLETGKQEIARAAAGATPYLRIFGTVAGGWLLAKGAAAASRRLAEGAGDPGFLQAKLATGRFYAENVLPQVAGLASQVITGAGSTLALDEALL
ncbi:MAG: acyl-CoA dehydrogenase [Rhodospirillales bacterium]|nr:acyl-CoA dehydrogenase [Rhodospirillales bacterium]